MLVVQVGRVVVVVVSVVVVGVVVRIVSVVVGVVVRVVSVLLVQLVVLVSGGLVLLLLACGRRRMAQKQSAAQLRVLLQRMGPRLQVVRVGVAVPAHLLHGVVGLLGLVLEHGGAERAGSHQAGQRRGQLRVVQRAVGLRGRARRMVRVELAEGRGGRLRLGLGWLLLLLLEVRVLLASQLLLLLVGHEGALVVAKTVWRRWLLLLVLRVHQRMLRAQVGVRGGRGTGRLLLLLLLVIRVEARTGAIAVARVGRASVLAGRAARGAAAKWVQRGVQVARDCGRHCSSSRSRRQGRRRAGFGRAGGRGHASSPTLWAWRAAEGCVAGGALVGRHCGRLVVGEHGRLLLLLLHHLHLAAQLAQLAHAGHFLRLARRLAPASCILLLLLLLLVTGGQLAVVLVQLVLQRQVSGGAQVRVLVLSGLVVLVEVLLLLLLLVVCVALSVSVALVVLLVLLLLAVVQLEVLLVVGVVVVFSLRLLGSLRRGSLGLVWWRLLLVRVVEEVLLLLLLLLELLLELLLLLLVACVQSLVACHCGGCNGRVLVEVVVELLLLLLLHLLRLLRVAHRRPVVVLVCICRYELHLAPARLTPARPDPNFNKLL